MRRFAFAPALVVAAPFLTILLACTAFVVWFGVAQERAVEAAAIEQQSERIGVLGGYLQHLVDDMVLNAEEFARSFASAGDRPGQEDLNRWAVTARSPLHLANVMLVDREGQILVAATEPTARLRGALQASATDASDGATFLPVEPEVADDDALPDFVFTAPLRTDPGVRLALYVTARSMGRATVSLTGVPASFAVLDRRTGTAVGFGLDPANGHWARQAFATLTGQRETAPENRTVTTCMGDVLTGHGCIVGQALRGSSLMLISLISAAELRAAWVHRSEAFWAFALMFLLSGASSSVITALWMRERRRDQAALNETVAELQSAYAAKSNFMAHMSHELRTPLNSIIGFSDLLRSAHFGPLHERYRAYAEDIHVSATHLHSLVSEILDLEQLEQRKLSVTGAQANLNLVAAEAVRMISVLAQAKGTTVELRQWPHPAIIEMQPQRATQVALNLISNAVKYSERGDRISVRVERNVDHVYTLVVSDEGIGMTAEEIAWTLEPFGQPAERRAGRDDSTGLGLPIVRGLLAAIGGNLVINSEKNRGTTVTAIFGPTRQVA